MSKIRKIFLCGYMGSGKSYVVQKVKDTHSVDLDEIIHQKKGQGHDRLGDYINAVGMERFREDETEVLKELLANDEELLVSLGGGALETGDNLELLRSDSQALLIWIDVDFETCWERIKNDSNRPLVKKGESFNRKLYADRIKTYCLSDIRLLPDQITGITCRQDLLDLLVD